MRGGGGSHCHPTARTLGPHHGALPLGRGLRRGEGLGPYCPHPPPPSLHHLQLIKLLNESCRRLCPWRGGGDKRGHSTDGPRWGCCALWGWERWGKGGLVGGLCPGVWRSSFLLLVGRARLCCCLLSHGAPLPSRCADIKRFVMQWSNRGLVSAALGARSCSWGALPRTGDVIALSEQYRSP